MAVLQQILTLSQDARCYKRPTRQSPAWRSSAHCIDEHGVVLLEISTIRDNRDGRETKEQFYGENELEIDCPRCSGRSLDVHCKCTR